MQELDEIFVRNEIRKQTGIQIDSFGNELNNEFELLCLNKSETSETSEQLQLHSNKIVSISSKPLINNYIGSVTSYKLNTKKPKSITKSKRLRRSKKRMNRILMKCDEKMKQLKL